MRKDTEKQITQDILQLETELSELSVVILSNVDKNSINEEELSSFTQDINGLPQKWKSVMQELLTHCKNTDSAKFTKTYADFIRQNDKHQLNIRFGDFSEDLLPFYSRCKEIADYLNRQLQYKQQSSERSFTALGNRLSDRNIEALKKAITKK